MTEVGESERHLGGALEGGSLLILFVFLGEWDILGLILSMRLEGVKKSDKKFQRVEA